MSKRGKDPVSDDKNDSPAPIRRSTRISLGQNLPGSPAPMGIKTRRGSSNSTSEEKITVEADSSPKDKRKTRRTSTDEDPKPAPPRTRRGSVSKVIEEEKTSIPNSPGRRSSRLSSSSPSFDAPARRTRRSSQDTETVEIPARRSTRRSSTGIQESTIEEIVEKAKPITRRRRSSSVDEQEENAKIENARPKTKRLFNEEKHLEPIKEQEQELKEKAVKEEEKESIQKLEQIQETTDDDETEKILEDYLNEASAEKSSPNKNISKREDCNNKLYEENNSKTIDSPEEKSIESLNKTMKDVDEKEQTITKEKAFDEEKSTLKEIPPTLVDSSIDVTNGKENLLEKPILQQEHVPEINKNISLNESCDKSKLDKRVNEKPIISSPGSDKENISINIKKKRLSIKRIEENAKNENTVQNGFAINQTSNNGICEPMEVDDDEDDLFKVQTPKKLSLGGNIGNEDKNLGTTENEIVVQNGDVSNVNSSIKEIDVIMEGSFSHVNSSPDKESSLLVDESEKAKLSETSLALSENKQVSKDVEETAADDYESDASIKLVDTDDEVEAAKMSIDEENKSVDTPEISMNQTIAVSDSEMNDTSIKLVDVEEQAKISMEEENIPVISSEKDTNQKLIDSNVGVINTSINFVETNDEKNMAKNSPGNEENNSVNMSETSTNQTLIVPDSELNESVFDKSFESSKNNSLSEEHVESNEKISNTVSVDQKLCELNKQLDSAELEAEDSNKTSIHVVFEEKSVNEGSNEKKLGTHSVNGEKKELSKPLESEGMEVVDLNNETNTSAVLEKNISSNLNESKNHIKEELRTLRSKRESGGKPEKLVLPNTVIVSLSAEEDNPNNESESRKSPKKSEKGKNDSFNIESLNGPSNEVTQESNSENTDSTICLSPEEGDKELHNESQEKIEGEHILNISTETKEESIKKDSETSCIESTQEFSSSTDKTSKIEEKECNVSKTDKSPRKKIILQKIEIVNISDIDIQKTKQLETKNQELYQDIEKSSPVRSRSSLSDTKIDITDNSTKSRMSNTRLSKQKIPIEKEEPEDEIHLISSSDEEILFSPEIVERSPIKTEIKSANLTEKSSKTNYSPCDYEEEKSLEVSGNEKKKVETKEKMSPKNKKGKNNQERIEIMHKSGIDVEDEESSSDENCTSQEFIDDMAEEVKDSLDEEESDENEIKDIGESVLSSDTDEDSSEDDYDSKDSFIDNDEQEELLSGEEDFIAEETTEKPKKNKFKRIIRQSSTSDEEEISEKCIEDQTRKSSGTTKNPGESIQSEETGKYKMERAIDSILKLDPEECSTPNKSISGTMNSSITESSVILQETCSVGAAKSRAIIDKIQGVVDVFCKNINEPEGDISLNVSLNYKPPSNPSSTRNSLNRSFGSQDLNQFSKVSPIKSSRLSVNEEKTRTSISPKNQSDEIVKIEVQKEQTDSETENSNPENQEHKNELPIKVEEVIEVSTKKKRSRKKPQKGKDSSVRKQELVTEETSSPEQNNETADQEECKASSTGQKFQTKQKRRARHNAEVHTKPEKIKKPNIDFEIESKNTVCDQNSSEKAKKVELKETGKLVDTKKNKHASEKKSKRSRDVSETTIGMKKVKYEQPAENKHIDSRMSKSTEVKKLKCKKREEDIPMNELHASKTSIPDVRQSQLKTTKIKEVGAQKSGKRLIKSENIGVQSKKTNESEHNEWDEEDIFVKPSSANNTKSGFNLEKYVGRDFKNRMIYDSLRNRREQYVKSRKQKK